MPTPGHPAIPRSAHRTPTEPVPISRPLSGQLQREGGSTVACVTTTGQGGWGSSRQPRTTVVALINTLFLLPLRVLPARSPRLGWNFAFLILMPVGGGFRWYGALIRSRLALLVSLLRLPLCSGLYTTYVHTQLRSHA